VVTVEVTVLREVTSDVVDAFGRLLPQLSTSCPRLDAAGLAAVVSAPSNTVLIARSAGQVIGTMTLVMFPIPTGVRAWIEDVVVDESARGQGAATAMILESLRLAADAGVRTVDLTSRAAREAAGRLYERLGFVIRDTRLYRYSMADRPAQS
jgi:ribosomal protein S18 acetylase RimI-like enzyme